MGKKDNYYIIVRHGDTHNDKLKKSIYVDYASKIVKYIYNICKHKSRPPVFLTSPLDRCKESAKIIVDLYNIIYGTSHKIIETDLLLRSGREENSKNKFIRLNKFIDYTLENYCNKNIIVALSHSSVIPALCPLIAGISPEEFKEKNNVHLNEGAICFVKHQEKILRYNRYFST